MLWRSIQLIPIATLFLSGLACDKTHPASARLAAPKQVSPSREISVDLTRLDEWSDPDTVNIHILYDHVFKSAKRYGAIPLLPILEQLTEQYGLDTAATEVFFICKDGYRPSMPLSQALRMGGGFLAFRDLDASPPLPWPDSLAASYSPFLLAWPNIPFEKHDMPWPWGLTGLQLVQNDPWLAGLQPYDAPQLTDAYTLYRENCMKCHALNQTGGNMGPEFNEPKNITEYWSRENIVAFAKAPTSFRRNSKMPPVQHLSDAELHLIVDYLEYLAGRGQTAAQ